MVLLVGPVAVIICEVLLAGLGLPAAAAAQLPAQQRLLVQLRSVQHGVSRVLRRLELLTHIEYKLA